MINCYQPGYNEGPRRTGEEPGRYLCERDGAHDGPHGWDFDLDLVDPPEDVAAYGTTWPVKETE